MSLSPLPAGPLELRVRKQGFVTTIQQFSLPREGKDLGEVTLRAGSAISGRVVDERGYGVPNVTVLAGANADLPFDYSTRTEPDGHFQLEDVPSEGVLYVQARSREVSGPAVKVTLPPGGPVELRVKAAKTLRGRVVDKETGEPVANAEVSGEQLLLRSAGGFALQAAIPISPATSDEDGFFALPLPEAGDVRLHVRVPGYTLAQRRVPIKEDEPLRLILIQLERGCILRGQVWETDGRPAVGVTVTAREAGEGNPRLLATVLQTPMSTTTDGQGRFVLSGLKPGKITVEAQSPEGGQDRVTLEVSGDAETELRLGAPGSLEVRVVGPQEEPLAGAKVEVLGVEEDLPQRLTDAAGVVRFTDLSPGTYSVTAFLEGFAVASKSVNVGPQGTASVTLKLARGGEIVGSVRGLSPQELARCRAWAGSSWTQVAADGSFHLKGVPTGKQELVVSVFPLGKTRRMMVNVQEGSPAQVEVDFGQGLTIAGTVRRGTQPVVGYLVVGTGASPLERASDTTDEQGRFALSGLAPGSWTLSVSDPNGQVLLTQRVEAQTDTQISLVLPEGRLSGWVRQRSNREPIAEAQVALEIPGQSAFLRRTACDEAGHFSFGELPTGQAFRVLATAPGYAPAESQVTVGETELEVELLLQPQQTLELVLRDADGSIPGEIFANVRGPSGEPQPLFVTLDREGRGVVTQLAPGEYVAFIHGQGAAVVRLVVPSKLQRQLKPRGQLILEAGDTPAEVRLVTAEGLPVPLGWRGMDLTGGWWRVESSFRVSLPAGGYHLLFRRGEQVESKTVNLAPGEQTVVVLAP